MSFESFRVELRGGPASYTQADVLVRGLPHAKPDALALDTPGSTYYTVEDGRHVIEVEVTASPVRVSCRFTLCHPPSIDNAFLNLVLELTACLGMEVSIRDDVLPEHAQGFSLARFQEFADLAARCIAARRAEWIANFGPAQFPAKMHEVYERFILPQCESVAK